MNSGKPVRIRVPVIPSFNYNEDDLVEIMLLLKSLPGKIKQVDLLPYHTLGNNKYKRFAMPNPMEGILGLNKKDLMPYREVFESNGFNTNIGG